MNPKGLTLVELMVTLVIAGMLALAALHVSTSIARAQAAIEPAHDASLLEARLEGLLRMDVLHAQAYQNLGNGFRLQSYARLDPVSLEMTHLPCTVSYEVRKVGVRNWLVRRQQAQGQDSTVDFVCWGVKSININPTGKSGGGSARYKAMPEAFKVVVAVEAPPPREIAMKLRMR